MSRLQIRPMPHAIHGMLQLMENAPAGSVSGHEVMRIMIRHLFDKNFTDRDALEALQGMMKPHLLNAEGLGKLAMEFSKLDAVLEETFHYHRMVRRESQMSTLYVPLGPDYALLSSPYDVIVALDTLRGMGKTLSETELVHRIEVPAGFNQLIAANAKGSDTLLQETITTKLEGGRLPKADERGYEGKEAEAYSVAVDELNMLLTHTYYNLLKPGWYDYRVEYPSDWEVIIIFTRKHPKLELIHGTIDPDEKEPA